MDDRQTPARTEWPREWLMTDDRLGDALWAILERMPTGAGVVLRDSSIGARVGEICARRALTLGVARDVVLAEALGAALVHNPAAATSLPVSRSVHDQTEAQQAHDEGAALVFVSPLFATRSHPGAAALGVDQAWRLAEMAGIPAIALGGMNAERFAQLGERGFYGWAGIDAWLNAERIRI